MNKDSGESNPRESALNYLWVTKKQKEREAERYEIFNLGYLKHCVQRIFKVDDLILLKGLLCLTAAPKLLPPEAKSAD